MRGISKSQWRPRHQGRRGAGAPRRATPPPPAGAPATRRSLLGRRAEVVALLLELAGLDPAHRLTDFRVAMHAAPALAVASIERDVHQHDTFAGCAVRGGKSRRVERQIFHRQADAVYSKWLCGSLILRGRQIITGPVEYVHGITRQNNNGLEGPVDMECGRARHR